MSWLYRKLVELLANLYVDTLRRAGEIMILLSLQEKAEGGQQVFIAPQGVMGSGEKRVEN